MARIIAFSHIALYDHIRTLTADMVAELRGRARAECVLAIVQCAPERGAKASSLAAI